VIRELGKAGGIVACAILFFLCASILRGVERLSDGGFVTVVQSLFATFFGGSALAAFRDWKKGNGSPPAGPA
jgi:hypothetical protein